MTKKVLSVFVDESGRFVLPDVDSRFYIVGFVLHDQGVALDEHIQRLEQSWFDLVPTNFALSLFSSGKYDIMSV